MKFRVSSELEYEVRMPTTFIFNIQAITTASQVISEERLTIDPALKWEEITLQTGVARFVKLNVPEATSFKISYHAIVDLYSTVIDRDQLLNAVPVSKLDESVIPFLFPSRYCQSDKLQRLASREFGSIENTYAKVSAISDWIYNNVEYLPGTTTSSTSAHDTLTERVGVCRDFAHLGITFCRALSIPARYFTCYAYNLNPPDFHACFEAYIGGEWVFFDPTKLVPVNGIVKIASGRDAADAAVASIFGDTTCTSMNVNCESVDPDFIPCYADDTKNKSQVSYT